MKVDISAIKELRNISKAGYYDCKRALELCDGSVDAAVKQLREVGHNIQEKNKYKTTSQGIIEAYIHPGSRIASMVEVRCETDFVAKMDLIKDFAGEIAMQVVALNPAYICRNDIPDMVVQNKRSLTCAESQGIEDSEIERYVGAQMERWYSEICLLEQPYIRDGSISVKDLLSSLVAAVGEACRITKIQRWEI